MKSKIFSAAFALLFIAATAFGFDRPQSSTKEVSVDGNYQKITVGSNIKMILVPAGQKTTVTVTGDQSRVNDVIVKLYKNEMIISSKKKV